VKAIILEILAILALPALAADAGLQQAMLAEVNAIRARAGRAPLTLDPRLSRAALAHAIDMLNAGRLGHAGSDGSDPAGPHKVDADGRVSTRYLWPELADGSRALHRLPLTGTDASCTGFVGLDHIVVSGALHGLLQQAGLGAAGVRKAAVVSKPGQLIETSDHCPQIGRLAF